MAFDVGWRAHQEQLARHRSEWHLIMAKRPFESRRACPKRPQERLRPWSGVHRPPPARPQTQSLGVHFRWPHILRHKQKLFVVVSRSATAFPRGSCFTQLRETTLTQVATELQLHRSETVVRHGRRSPSLPRFGVLCSSSDSPAIPSPSTTLGPSNYFKLLSKVFSRTHGFLNVPTQMFIWLESTRAA